MTTVADLIEQTKRHLYGGGRVAMNLLSSSITTTDSTVSVTRSQNVGDGSLISIENEIMLAYDIDGPGKSMTVLRGQLGTTAASHASATVIEVNPRFPRAFIIDALKDEVRSWKKIYKVASASFTVTANSYVVDLTSTYASAHGVIDVQYSPQFAGQGSWKSAGFTALSGMKLVRSADSDDISSGFGLHVPGGFPYSGEIRVLFAMPFTTTSWTEATDVNSTVGLDASMEDIAPLGAAARLIAPRDIRRLDMSAQGEPDRPDGVQPGQALSVAANLRKLADDRIGQEAQELYAKYPVKIR